MLEFGNHTLSVGTLVLANLIQLAGVLLWGWSLFDIMAIALFALVMLKTTTDIHFHLREHRPIAPRQMDPNSRKTRARVNEAVFGFLAGVPSNAISLTEDTLAPSPARII